MKLPLRKYMEKKLRKRAIIDVAWGGKEPLCSDDKPLSLS